MLSRSNRQRHWLYEPRSLATFLRRAGAAIAYPRDIEVQLRSPSRRNRRFPSRSRSRCRFWRFDQARSPRVFRDLRLEARACVPRGISISSYIRPVDCQLSKTLVVPSRRGGWRELLRESPLGRGPLYEIGAQRSLGCGRWPRPYWSGGHDWAISLRIRMRFLSM